MASLKAKRIIHRLKDGGYLYYRSGNYLALVNADHCELRAYLDSLDRLFDDAEILKNTRSTTAARINIPESESKAFFLKRYNNRGWWYSFRYIFRKARPWRVKIISDQLRDAGINTPMIIAAAVKRRLGIFMDTGYLMTEWLNDLIPANQLVPQLLTNKALFTQYRDQVVFTLNHLHENGIRHGDLKIFNISCQFKDDGLEVGLLDLDGSERYRKRLSAKKRVQDISRFIASIIQVARELDIPVDIAQIAEFVISEYERISGFELNNEFLHRSIMYHLERRRKASND